MTYVEQLLKTYPPISYQMDVQELRVVLKHLDHILTENVPGDLVEFGCYIGTTSLYMSRLLVHLGSEKTLHVYDSFEGLPKKSAYDESPAGDLFVRGELSVSKQTFISQYHKARIPLPKIHKGWFKDVSSDQLPDAIAFAFLDGDFYESIMQSLQLIEPRLAPGACIIIDDYQSEALPGAAKAVDEWHASKGWTMQVQASLAIIHKSVK